MCSNSDELQKFLDSQQYTRKGILLYERIFGRTYVSTGGKETTAKFCQVLGLRPGQRVLDVGCGIGGSAFHMAARYGASVYGVDLSTNMVGIANEYRKEASAGVQHLVQFHVEDATSMKYPDNFYDVVYSRDTILHIADKPALFKKFYQCLKPGGVVLISDYCHGDQQHNPDFKEYVKQRGYNLLTVKEYGRTLEEAGFEEVEAKDNTEYFVEILKKELEGFRSKKAEVSKEFAADSFEHICTGWEDKVVRCGKGDQVWGYFLGRKMFK